MEPTHFERLIIDARNLGTGHVAVYLMATVAEDGPEEDLHFLYSKPTLDEAVQWAMIHMQIEGISGEPKLIMPEPESTLIEQVTAFLKSLGEPVNGDDYSGGDPF